MLVFLVARDRAGAAIGCGALRQLDAETVELERMHVAPAGAPAASPSASALGAGADTGY